jgi:8-oxo-dGTP diphosphatase
VGSDFIPQTPYLCVDGIIELYENDTFEGIVLIERKNRPYGLAIPGGFVDRGETLESAVVREMKEETNLDVQITSLLNIYSDPQRDPRFHTASAVYICRAEGAPVGQDDAKEAKVYTINEIPWEKLVFDHEQILRDYIQR